jgi:CheY-like chemotaxis protein
VRPERDPDRLKLPRETGFEFAESMRRAAPEPVRAAPIIAITATSPKVALRPHPAIDAVVRKPVELDELCRLVEADSQAARARKSLDD